MRKRFVVATNGTTVLQDQAFKEALNTRFPRLGWWHRLDELWLIVEDEDRLDAKTLRVIARECFAPKKLLVLEIREDGDNWAGLGPAGSAQEMFAWLHTHWKNE